MLYENENAVRLLLEKGADRHLTGKFKKQSAYAMAMGGQNQGIRDLMLFVPEKR